MRQILTALTVLFAIAAGGAGVLWSLGALSEWRRIPYDPALNSLYRYLAIVLVTVCVYQFASALVTISPLDKLEMWQTWCYLRWVLISGLAAWAFADLTPEADKMKRAAFFLQGYVALLIVGLFGTGAGVKTTALKRELKQ